MVVFDVVLVVEIDVEEFACLEGLCDVGCEVQFGYLLVVYFGVEVDYVVVFEFGDECECVFYCW